MHELGIAQGILDLVGEHVPPADAERVRDVRVRVGALSGVSADALEFGFDALAPSSPFPCARLLIERVPAIARCLQCGARSEADRPVLACPACASPRVVLLDGAELQVVDIALADAPAEAAP